ncbi:chemotaxis protein CheW [Flavisphingomonas formosensis]|uniref:chemotaxis protein CheW n=1 Tax=Flavisphingomonas formosensis TaxID=861534 RepID=UPI0012F94CE9|nr:chemotaxis protein CheW [Sphingomonas formosensis]
MNGLFLVALIAGERVVLATEEVESVVELEAITPVPRLAPHIAGLTALRSRVLTVIDCRTALGLGMSPREGVLPAIVVNIEGHGYGLLVDHVEDVATIEGEMAPILASLQPGWAVAGRGMVTLEGDALLLVDPAVLVAGPALAAA